MCWSVDGVLKTPDLHNMFFTYVIWNFFVKNPVFGKADDITYEIEKKINK